MYIPMGGSRGGIWMKIRNTFILFLVSGLWHGANWTFIIWGALNAIYFLPLMLTNKNRNNIETVAKGKQLPTIRETIQMITTFALFAFSLIFFRAQSVEQAINYIRGIFTTTFFQIPHLPEMGKVLMTILITILFFIIEWIGREEQYAIARLGLTWKRPVRIAMYYAILITILCIGGKGQQFIYFQF